MACQVPGSEISITQLTVRRHREDGDPPCVSVQDPPELAVQVRCAGSRSLRLTMIIHEHSSKHTWRRLFHGAVRESLANVSALAASGPEDTRAWEPALDYVASDNHGNVGVVEFGADGAIAAMIARSPSRTFDVESALVRAPLRWQADLRRLCGLPLLTTPHKVTGLFWTESELLAGPEDWQDRWWSGAELFEHELMDDDAWRDPGAAYYGLSADVVEVAITVARRADARRPLLRLTPSELEQLVPASSQHRKAAMDLLFAQGMFELRAPRGELD